MVFVVDDYRCLKGPLFDFGIDRQHYIFNTKKGINWFAVLYYIVIFRFMIGVEIVKKEKSKES